MQEGAGRGGRRPEEGRRAAAHQEWRQGEQGGEPRRGRGRHRRLPVARREPRRSRRAQLRDRFRGEERRIPRLRQVAGGGRRDPKSQGPGAARVTENRAAAPGAGAEDRREHLDPPLSPHAGEGATGALPARREDRDRKSTRLNSSHLVISYAVFCLKKKKQKKKIIYLKKKKKIKKTN